MKTTITLVALALCVGASGAFGQQTYPVSNANPPLPVGRYIEAQNVSAFGANANRAISGELSRGAGGGGGGCTSGCCTPTCCTPACSDCACSSCDHCCAAKCSYGCCLHRTGGFAEYLYLSARNIDLAFGVPQDGIGGAGTVPVGEVGVLDLDYSSGFRVGANLAIDCCSSARLTYTYFDVDTTNAIDAVAPNVIQPLVMFPGTFNAGFTSQAAAGLYDLEYQLVDADFRSVLWSCKGAHVDYVVGGRYAHLDSQFAAVFPFAPPDGTTAVFTDISFDGAGLRLGLEGERRIFRHSGLSVYSKGYINALAGQFQCDYVQVNQFNGVEAVVGYTDDRLITISEMEVGVTWTNCRGNVKVGAGYYVAVWDNVITTPEWINSVQQVNFVDVSQDDNDTIAFDGLVIHAELMF